MDESESYSIVIVQKICETLSICLQSMIIVTLLTTISPCIFKKETTFYGNFSHILLILILLGYFSPLYLEDPIDPSVELVLIPVFRLEKRSHRIRDLKCYRVVHGEMVNTVCPRSLIHFHLVSHY